MGKKIGNLFIWKRRYGIYEEARLNDKEEEDWLLIKTEELLVLSDMYLDRIKVTYLLARNNFSQVRELGMYEGIRKGPNFVGINTKY